MALFPCSKMLFSAAKSYAKNCINSKVSKRNLRSQQLIHCEFGDPLHVVKFRDSEVRPLAPQEVLVRMMAAPVNPNDINIIQGRNTLLPCLPNVPGDEGVGEVVEIGSLVCRVVPGQRVVLTTRLLGTWTYYGIFHERDLHVVSSNLPLPEASMLTIAPCTAYRMIKDFRSVKPGQTVIQNAANSPCGQCVIQLCHEWGINTFNIVASHCGYNAVKEHLLSLGASAVFTLEEAENLPNFDTSLSKPVLALNCLGGRFENVLLRLLEYNGDIVYYAGAYDLPTVKEFLRPDVNFHKFHLHNWHCCASAVENDTMLTEIVQQMVIGKFKAPMYLPVELKNYIFAFRNTVHCEAFCTTNIIFDFCLP